MLNQRFFPPKNLSVDNTVEHKLDKFVPGHHYEIIPSKIKKDGVQLSDVRFKVEGLGLELIAEYYNEKYAAKITLCPHGITNDCKEIFAKIRTHKNINQDDRHAVIFGAKEKHAFPVVYIREKGEEYILIADSVMPSREDAENLSKITGLPVYAALNVTRVAENTGCRTDALVYGRIATAQEDEKYSLPNLLAKLKSQLVERGKGYIGVRLPEEFLITSQISSFNAYHNTNPGKVTPKQEKYTQKNVLVDGKAKASASDYLRQKSFKFVNLMEIQFYIRQLKNILGKHWTPAIKKDFVDKAKIELKKQGDLAKRKGLYDFVQAYQAALLKPQKPQEAELSEIIIVKNESELTGIVIVPNQDICPKPGK